jgi:hypothetical protein
LVRRWNRAVATLVAVAACGFLLWYVPHFNRWTTGGYWGVIAVTAIAGVLIGLSQVHTEGKTRRSFLFAFLPVVVAAGWVILATQPRGTWIRDHVLSWSDDLGIDHAVHNLGEHVAVLAFGLGVIFGATFEPKLLRRGPKKVVAAPVPVEVPPGEPPPAADTVVGEPSVEEPPAETAEPGQPSQS